MLLQEEVFKLMSDYVVDKDYTTKCLKDFYTEFEYTPNRRIKQILQTSIDKVFTKTNELNLVKFWRIIQIQHIKLLKKCL